MSNSDEEKNSEYGSPEKRIKKLKLWLAVSVFGAVICLALPVTAVLMLGDEASVIPFISAAAAITQSTAAYGAYCALRRYYAFSYSKYEQMSPYFDFAVGGTVRENGGKKRQGRFYFYAGRVSIVTLRGMTFGTVSFPKDALTGLRLSLFGMKFRIGDRLFRLSGAWMLPYLGRINKWKKRQRQKNAAGRKGVDNNEK